MGKVVQLSAYRDEQRPSDPPAEPARVFQFRRPHRRSTRVTSSPGLQGRLVEGLRLWCQIFLDERRCQGRVQLGVLLIRGPTLDVVLCSGGVGLLDRGADSPRVVNIWPRDVLLGMLSKEQITSAALISVLLELERLAQSTPSLINERIVSIMGYVLPLRLPRD